MVIIDSQVHAYERDHPGRPWAAVLHGPPQVTGEEMVAAMDAAGVDAAILVSPFTMYRYDASYAVSVRIMMTRGNVSTDPADPGIARVLSAAARNGLPVNLLCWGRLDQVDQIARANPGTQLVIDHLGLQQPFEPPAPPQPFAELPKVLKLASYPNVTIKISGACTLSHEPFPYKDIWDPLARIFDAYGLDRCMWGTDWTRAVALLTYKQGVDAFRLTDRLSDSDRAKLMGGSLQKIYKWSPSR